MGAVVVLLNGAFGVGKTTVAQLLERSLPGSAIFDPERIGFVLKRLPRFVPLQGRGTDDFQDLALWRWLTVREARRRARRRTVLIVPQALSSRAYLAEIRDGIGRGGQAVVHFCLVAPLEVVQGRLRARGDAGAWELRRPRRSVLRGARTHRGAIARGDRPDHPARAGRTRCLAQPSPVAIGTSSASPHSAHDPS